jgi:UDP-glucose 4-epimerase
VAALERGKVGEIYNLGTGIGSSNLDLLRWLESLAAADGIGINVTHLPERRFDVSANVLDPSKLQAATGWQPKVPLAEGLASMWHHALQRRLSAGSP